MGFLSNIEKFLDSLKKKIEEAKPPVTPPKPTNPTPQPTPTAPPATGGFVSDKVYGLMITDLICDTEIEKRKSDLDKLRGSYNTILTVLDLQKSGTIKSRPYVDWARNKTDLTPLGIKNLRYIKALGWKVHLVLLNSWGLKSGFSGQMGSTQKTGLNESNAYTSELLAQEKAFVTTLLSKYGELVDGIMPCLEAQVDAGARFSYEVGKVARNLGFNGVISYNVPESSYDFKGIRALKARSQNDIAGWTNTNNDIRNSDGMPNVGGNAANINKIYTNPGPAGFYLWSPDFIGGTSGRSPAVSNIYLLNGAGPVTEPNNPTEPNMPFDKNTDSVAGTSAANIEKAMKFWFPKIPYKTDSNGSTSSQFMWKPISDSGSKLAIHTPAGENIVKVTVGTETASNSAIANGKRGTFRFSKKGGDYGNAKVVLHYASGTTKTFFGTGATRMDKSLSQIPNLVTVKAGEEPAPTPIPDPTPTPEPNVPYKVILQNTKLTDTTFSIPAGFSAARVIITKGYDADTFAGIVIAKNIKGPTTISLPANFLTLPRTSAGELLIWLDCPIKTAPYRQIEFWVNPSTKMIRFGEVWEIAKASGGSFYEQAGYPIRAGNSAASTHKRAYAAFDYKVDSPPTPQPTPEPTPDPAPQPDPTPEPTPTPVGSAIYQNRPGFFMEAQGASSNFGCTNPIIMALNGVAVSGFTGALLHPWYGEFKTERNESYVRGWAKECLSDARIKFLSMDHEGWTLKSPEVLRWLYEEAVRVGKYFIDVPKIVLDHQQKAWRMTYAQVVSVMNRYTHGIAGWIYNYKGVHYASAYQTLKTAGYKGQFWAVGDDGNRPHYGGITVADAVATVKYLAARNINFMLFNPKAQSKAVTDAMAAAYDPLRVSSLQDVEFEILKEEAMPDPNAPCNETLWPLT